MNTRSLSESLLLLHAAGAADPGDAAFFESVLASDPEALRRYEAIAARRRALFTPVRWPTPTSRIQAEAAWMDAESLGVGDVLTLHLPEAPPSFRPLLVRETDSSTARILHPVDLEDWLALGDLPSDGPRRLLDLVLDDPPGIHRYTVVLVPPDWPVDRTLPEDLRWEPARAGLEAGELRGAFADVVVAPRRP